MKRVLKISIIFLFFFVILFNYSNNIKENYLLLDDEFDYILEVEDIAITEGQVISYSTTPKSSTCKGQIAIKIEDPSIIKLNGNNLIEGLKEGKTNLVTEWCGVTKSVEITVSKVETFDFSLTLDKYEISVGDSITFSSTNLTDNVCKQPSAIKVADTAIAKLTGGKIIGLKPGKTSLIVKWCGVTKEESFIVKELSAFDYEIVLDKHDIAVEERIDYQIKDNGSTCKEQIAIKVDDPNIAKLEDGKIIGLAEGQTNISVKWCGIAKNALINVINSVNFDYTLTLDKEEILVNENVEYHVDSVGSTCKGSYAIKIDDTSVAKINNGKIIGLAEGETKLYVDWCGITKTKDIKVISNNTSNQYNIKNICLIIGVIALIIVIVFIVIKILKNKKKNNIDIL